MISKKVNLRFSVREINGFEDDVIHQITVSEKLCIPFQNIILNRFGKYSFYDPKFLRLDYFDIVSLGFEVHPCHSTAQNCVW